jgi:hypothetical protein
MGSIPLSALPLSVCPWQKTSHHIAHSGWATPLDETLYATLSTL